MKGLLKEYFETKGLRSRITVLMILYSVYFVINARITFWIANVLENAHGKEMDTMWWYLELLVVGCVVNSVIDLVTSKMIRECGAISYTDTNTKVAEKILKADYDVFMKYSSGNIQTIVDGITCISQSGKMVINITRSSLNLICIIGSICIIEPSLILPILVIYGIGAVIIKKVWDKIGKIDTEWREKKNKRNDEIHKVINGFAEVRSNCTENYHLSKIREMNEEALDLICKKANIVAWNNFSFNVIDTIIMMVIISFAIIGILAGRLEASIGMSLVIYGWRLLDPLISILDEVDQISLYKAEYVKYREFMDIDNKIVDGGVELEGFNSSIRFENVSFSYDKSSMILQNMNLDIKKGEKIGICGHSGEGKSTLLRLIPRFYDTTDGNIYIDGLSIKDYNIHSLREKIGIVHQSNYIFKGSIYDNIIYGLEKVVSEAEVIEAAKRAFIFDFIESLPEKFNTDVGPNGLKLSGGQQQRIALARVFLQNPDIVLLDEATSALDTEAEAVIKDSMNLFSNKTVITVAHRLSTIKDCDRIVLINEHDVAEEGSHEELMTKRGLYYNLYNV